MFIDDVVSSLGKVSIILPESFSNPRVLNDVLNLGSDGCGDLWCNSVILPLLLITFRKSTTILENDELNRRIFFLNLSIIVTALSTSKSVTFMTSYCCGLVSEIHCSTSSLVIVLVIHLWCFM
eukprot:NODE_12_length_45166_cov_0.552511.p22 type:complete len:123 gc:universal NODE_12_length_45166_cov_0.552511:18748-19116(+)